jgi:hypothetical protein
VEFVPVIGRWLVITHGHDQRIDAALGQERYGDIRGHYSQRLQRRHESHIRAGGNGHRGHLGHAAGRGTEERRPQIDACPAGDKEAESRGDRDIPG